MEELALRECKKCHKEKEKSAYAKDRRECKECYNKAQKERYHKKKQRSRAEAAVAPETKEIGVQTSELAPLEDKAIQTANEIDSVSHLVDTLTKLYIKIEDIQQNLECIQRRLEVLERTQHSTKSWLNF